MGGTTTKVNFMDRAGLETNISAIPGYTSPTISPSMLPDVVIPPMRPEIAPHTYILY